MDGCSVLTGPSDDSLMLHCLYGLIYFTETSFVNFNQIGLLTGMYPSQHLNKLFCMDQAIGPKLVLFLGRLQHVPLKYQGTNFKGT